MASNVFPIPNPTPFTSAPDPSDSSFSAILQAFPKTIATELENASHFLYQLFINQILPAILFAAAFVGLCNLGQVVSKLIWPPSGREIYQEALALLKKDAFVENDGNDQEGGQSSNRSPALDLLRTAIAKDPELEEAYVTLATELLYGLSSASGEDIDAALEVLTDAKRRFPKNKEVLVLLTEAKGMKMFGRGGTEAATAKMRKMAGMGMFGSDNLGGGARVR